MTWDDADVVSAHGRPWEAAVDAVARSSKVAVLTAPANPPETLGKELLARGCRDRSVVVASRLGEIDELVVAHGSPGAGRGQLRPALGRARRCRRRRVPTGLRSRGAGTRTTFEHRDGMITKSEVRSVVLGKLELPRRGVLWDVGAGSGSVGIEAATIAPEPAGVRRRAVGGRRRAASASNAAAAGVADRVEVVEAEAPAALRGAARPGPGVRRRRRSRRRGGGVGAVAPGRCARGHLRLARPGGRGVRAARNAWCRSTWTGASPVGDSGFRLAPLNPVLICWGRR